MDGVRSTAYVPYRDIGVVVMNDTIKPFLAGNRHEQPVVDGMHRAWCKSVQLQVAIWAKPYSTQVVGKW